MKINIELEIGIESGVVVGGLNNMLKDLEYLGKTDCDLYKIVKNLYNKIEDKIVESIIPHKMTTYQFGSLFTGGPIEKSFETDIEAFEYAHGMTDGPDIVPVWKIVDNKRYAWHQQGWYDGEWVEVVEKEA